MNTTAGEAPLTPSASHRFSIPMLSGIGTVFRRRRRGARASTEVVRAACLSAAMLTVSAAIQTLLFGHSLEYTSHAPGVLARLLTTETVSATLCILPFAAVLGARSAPSGGESDGVRDEMLTRLSAVDLCVGRLLAGLLAPAAAIILSCVCWLTVSAVVPFEVGHHAVWGPIVLGHTVALSALWMVGATAFLASIWTRNRSGILVGCAAGLVLSVLCVSGLFAINARIRTARDPSRLIFAALLMNPATAAASSYHFDILRVDWIYRHTEAPDYPFEYPPASELIILFIGVGVVCQAAASRGLRRAMLCAAPYKEMGLVRS